MNKYIALVPMFGRTLVNTFLRMYSGDTLRVAFYLSMEQENKYYTAKVEEAEQKYIDDMAEKIVAKLKKDGSL